MQRVMDALTNRAVTSDIAVRQAVGQLVVAPYQMNKPIWTTGDPARYVDEGWHKAPVVFACVMAIADAASTAPIQVFENTGEGEPEPADATPLGTLMRRPNADLDGAEFVQVVTTIAALSGFCVIEKERDQLGNVIGLYPLRSDWLKPVPRQQSAPAWAYHIPGHRDPYILEPEDVIVHTHAPDPNLGYRGTSPLAVAFRELGIENTMTDFLKAFFDRGALPVYGIVPKHPIKDQAQADAFRSALMGKYAGALNAAEPMIAICSSIDLRIAARRSRSTSTRPGSEKPARITRLRSIGVLAKISRRAASIRATTSSQMRPTSSSTSTYPSVLE